MNSIRKLLLFIAIGTLSVPVANAQSVKQLEALCALGNVDECFKLGWMYSKGEGVRQDKSKAVELYTKACDGGYADGCSNLGLMYLRSEDVRQDMLKIAELFTKACNGRSAIGCGNLGLMYQRGEGVQQDNSKAVELFTKACEGGDATGATTWARCTTKAKAFVKISSKRLSCTRKHVVEGMP